ncbi:hypothetical protein HY311_02815 [Candidatus Nomurabacteria bacterium]|nr:hypothetical protein [Candidatus Nomurabacteria bacterium]
MKNKIAFLVVLLLVVFGTGLANLNVANAQVSNFPAGCVSALGYSITTGIPCSGTGTATNGPLPGCTTPLGYSITNGVPCSGSSVVLQYLAGCTSTSGYSTIDTSRLCNGTVASSIPVTIPGGTTTPGLPRTGAGGNALGNILVLLVSGLGALAGTIYLVRKPNVA